MQARSTKECGCFPYGLRTVCYFEVDGSGNTHPIRCDRMEAFSAYDRAVAGQTKIYAVWAGQWRSDLFIVDDLEAFLKANSN